MARIKEILDAVDQTWHYDCVPHNDDTKKLVQNEKAKPTAKLLARRTKDEYEPKIWHPKKMKT